jgi:DHA2 family multidrug resistance protein
MGIAIMATLLTRFTTEKKAQLTEHLTTMDPTSLGRLNSITNGLMSRGTNPTTAKQQALMILDRQLQAQASVLAFSRIYILSGIILLAVLPLLFLFKTGKNRGSAGLAH